MAKIVGALGLPHTPVFPMLAAKFGAESEIARYFARARLALEEARPDAIVLLDTDHLNTFFLDNLPTFAIGVDRRFTGPVDEVPALPSREIPSHLHLALHLQSFLVGADFDVSRVEEYVVDHSVAVPLHFVTPAFDIPVVPIFINGHVKPLPSARRCFRLGRAIREAIESWSGEARVLVAASGSFSLEVCGPRIDEGSTFGVPDPEWSLRVQALIEGGQIEQLIDEATEERMFGAGNVGGELLNWIALLGVVDGQRPVWMQDQVANGHAYAAWAGRA